jgi:hypothetical protein
MTQQFEDWHALDLRYPCLKCGAQAGEECQGFERSFRVPPVHFNRRLLRIATEKGLIQAS